MAGRTWLGCAWGWGLSAAALVIVATLGLLPEGQVVWAWVGFGLAVAVGTIGALLQVRLAAVSGNDPQAARQFLLGLAAPFGLHVLAAMGGVLALSWSGMKFEAVATFGLSFVSVVTVVHSASAVALGRALRERGRPGMAGCEQ